MVCPCCLQCSCLRTTAEYPLGAEHPAGWGKPAVEPSENVGLVTLAITSCLGSGAEGTAEVPTAFAPCDYESAKGPIISATVTAGGSGYAVFGREAPNLSVTAKSEGTGATFVVRTLEVPDTCPGLTKWIVQSVEASGGSGYKAGEELVISPADGNTVEIESAYVLLDADYSQPTLSISGNAAATFSYGSNDAHLTNERWSISSISVTNGGSGYVDGDSLVVVLGTDDFEETAASLVGYTKRQSPTLSLGFPDSEGVDAALTPVLTETPGDFPVWSITEVEIDAAGTGYEVGDVVEATIVVGQSDAAFSGQVDGVSETGEILSVGISSGGIYYEQTDELSRVTVQTGGSYYKDDGALGGKVQSPFFGAYYRANPALPAIVDATVTINQTLPSNGTGGAISAVVDTDTSSPTFGQVTGLTVDQGGEGYVTVTPCDFGNTLYITWHDRTGQKPIWIEEQSFNWNTGTDGVIYEADENGDPILTEHVRCGAALLSASFDQEGAIAPYYNFGVNCDPKEGDPLIESASMANAYLLWPSLECRCSQSRKLYVSLFLNFSCNICTETGVDNYTLAVGRELCYSWEIDPETGCPVGDAVLTTLKEPEGNAFAASPEPWQKISPYPLGSSTTVETAPCMDGECDPFLMTDFPEISFLPP